MGRFLKLEAIAAIPPRVRRWLVDLQAAGDINKKRLPSNCKTDEDFQHSDKTGRPVLVPLRLSYACRYRLDPETSAEPRPALEVPFSMPCRHDCTGDPAVVPANNILTVGGNRYKYPFGHLKYSTAFAAPKRFFERAHDPVV